MYCTRSFMKIECPCPFYEPGVCVLNICSLPSLPKWDPIESRAISALLLDGSIFQKSCNTQK